MFWMVQLSTGFLLGAAIVLVAPYLSALPPEWMLFIVGLLSVAALGYWLWWLYSTRYGLRPWLFAALMMLGAIGGVWL